MSLLQTANLRLDVPEPGLAVLWLDDPDRAVNVIHRQWLSEFDSALTAIAADPSLRQLVITSARPSGFLAGADVRELVAIQSPAEASALSEQGQRRLDRLEKLPVVTAALIHGPCLGGGLELALACDYRLAFEPLQDAARSARRSSWDCCRPGAARSDCRASSAWRRALRMILAAPALDAREAAGWRLLDRPSRTCR